MTFRTSTPNHPLLPTGHSERQVRNVKFGKTGVRGFYNIMPASFKGLKMFPEVRNAIARSGNHVILGLTSCRAYDRFWATQCRHCQKFGHTKERCPTKNTIPACSFCAGPHTLLNFPDKSVLKCVNGFSLDSPAAKCHHSASSLDCPV